MRNRTVVRFFVNSNDGDDTELLCVDGKWHIATHKDIMDRSIAFEIRGRCDGTCGPNRPVMDLRVRLAEYPAKGLKLKRDSSACLLLKGKDPVVGIVFSEGYCKRDSEWVDLCVAGTHVHSTSICDHTISQHYLKHEVRTKPCDGSCRPQPYRLSKRKARDLEISIATTR